MNRNLVIAIAVVVVVSLGVAFVLVPAMAQESPGMTISLYDADGEKVYEVGAPTGPFFELAFQNVDGAIVVTAVAHITYEVTVTGNLGVATVSGELVVQSYLVDNPDLAIKTQTIILEDKATLTDFYDKTIILVDLIEVSYQETTSFVYVFTATLTATAGGIDSAPWSDSCTLLIDWVPDGLEITGSISI